MCSFTQHRIARGILFSLKRKNILNILKNLNIINILKLKYNKQEATYKISRQFHSYLDNIFRS